MNKKIIIFSCALAVMLQPALITAETPFHLMDKDRLTIMARQLEGKNNEQQRRIACLEKHVNELSENQQTTPLRVWHTAQGAIGGVGCMLVVIGILALKKQFTKRRGF
jgi:hypothetical protein